MSLLHWTPHSVGCGNNILCKNCISRSIVKPDTAFIDGFYDFVTFHDLVLWKWVGQCIWKQHTMGYKIFFSE